MNLLRPLTKDEMDKVRAAKRLVNDLIRQQNLPLREHNHRLERDRPTLWQQQLKELKPRVTGQPVWITASHPSPIAGTPPVRLLMDYERLRLFVRRLKAPTWAVRMHVDTWEDAWALAIHYERKDGQYGGGRAHFAQLQEPLLQMELVDLPTLHVPHGVAA